MIKFVKELVDGSPTEWLHGHCYINFNALVAKAKNSDQYKVVTPDDIRQLTDGRYVVVNEEGSTILFKQNDYLVFILSLNGHETILTNTNVFNTTTVLNQYGKVVKDKLQFLKTTLTWWHLKLTPFQLFEVTNTADEVVKKSSSSEHFFGMVLGRDLTHLEKEMVNHLFPNSDHSKIK